MQKLNMASACSFAGYLSTFVKMLKMHILVQGLRTSTVLRTNHWSLFQPLMNAFNVKYASCSKPQETSLPVLPSRYEFISRKQQLWRNCIIKRPHFESKQLPSEQRSCIINRNLWSSIRWRGDNGVEAIFEVSSSTYTAGMILVFEEAMQFTRFTISIYS